MVKLKTTKIFIKEPMIKIRNCKNEKDTGEYNI
jgi:hypothetical protein